VGQSWRPATLQEATACIDGKPATIIAGGTDVFPPLRSARLPGDVLDLSAIEELRAITDDGGHWRIGATATWRDIIEAPLPACFDGLKAAAREVGGPQIQNAGTIGGNICNASPAADGVPPLLTLDAEVELRRRDSSRRMALGDFIRGNRDCALEAGEIVAAVLLPKLPARACSAFSKLGARRYQVISIVSVAGVMVADEAGRIADLRLAVGSCAATAVRLRALEQRLLGQPPALAGVIEAGDLAPLVPIDDCRGSAAYRLDAAAVLVRRLLADLGGRVGSTD
jgi:CO/xanthine dehydrogenase FAD-binding subunit